MTAPTFDSRPLTDPVDRATVTANRKQLIASGRAPRNGSAAGIVIAIVFVVFVVIFSVNTFVTIVVMSFAIDDVGGQVASLVVFAAVALGVALLLLRSSRASAERWYRLDRFAQANGMTWFPQAADPPLPGMIFAQGSSRQASDILRGDRPRFVEFANYRYTTGSGKNRTTHRWGYVAIKLA